MALVAAGYGYSRLHDGFSYPNANAAPVPTTTEEEEGVLTTHW